MASENFKNECKNYANANRLGKIIVDGETIRETDNISGIQVEDSCVSNGLINGTTNNRTVTFDTINYKKELMNKKAKVYVGVNLDGSEEFQYLGRFDINGEDARDTENSGTYRGSNQLNKLDEVYKCQLINLTTSTIGDFFVDACNQAGLMPESETFTNSDILVGGNPFTNNETIRTVISNCISASLGFADISESNALQVRWLTSDLKETFSKEDYTTLIKNKTYGPVNTLVIRDTYTDGENVTVEELEEEVVTKINGKTYQFGTPTPDDPKEIRTLKGFNTEEITIDGHTYEPYNCLGIKRTGKNVFLYGKNTSSTLKGVTVATDNDGIITVSGTCTSFTTFYSESFDLKKGTYTFSISDDSYSEPGIIVSIPTIDNATLSSTIRNNIVYVSGDCSVRCMVRISPRKTFENAVLKIQLERNYEVTDFEPYKETIDYIDLKGSEVLNDDYITIDKGNVILHKNWGKVVLDGSLSWSKTGTNVDRYYYKNEDLNTSQYNQIKCTHFTWNDTAETVGICTSNYQGFVGFAFSNKGESTLDDFITWLSINKPIVYYKSATPQSIILEQNKNIEYYDGVNDMTVLASIYPSSIENKVDYVGHITTYGEYFKVTEHEPCEFTIDDNYFLYTEALKKQAITKLWEKVRGLTYVDCELTSYKGKPYLHRGDKIRIEEANGTHFDTYVLDHKFTFDGAFTSVIKSPALDTAQTALKNSQSLSTKIRNVQRTVDKVNGRIDDTIEDIDKDYAKKSYVSQTKDSITQSVSEQLTNYATNGDIETLSKTVKTTQDNASLAIQISQGIQQNGVNKVITSNNYEFSSEGLKISDSDSANSSVIDNTGTRNYSYGTLQSIFNYKGSGVKKLIVTDTAQEGYHKIQKNTASIGGATKKLTSFYYLENAIEDLEDLESDN